MEAKDLMIGDWVQTPVDKSRIIYIGKYSGCYTDSTKDGERDYMPAQLKPIPLTPEILEKNGFEILDFSHYHIQNRALVLDADGKWEGPLEWNWVVTEMDTNAKGQPYVLDWYVATIHYVHELQHALRLCGIDKEIIL